MSGLVDYKDSDASSDESDQEKKRAVPGLEHSQSFNSMSAQIADLTIGMENVEENVEATAESFTDADVDEAKDLADYTMECKKDEDGTPKKVSLHKGPNGGLYYLNEAGNKVYGTPAARHVEMIENDEE